MESVFFEPPVETKIGAKNRRVREIERIYSVRVRSGKRLLV